MQKTRTRRLVSATLLACAGAMALAGCGGASGGTAAPATLPTGTSSAQSVTPSAATFQSLVEGRKLVQTGDTLVKIDISSKSEINKLEEEGFDIWMVGPGYLLGVAPESLFNNLQLRTNKPVPLTKPGFVPQNRFDPGYLSYDELVTELNSIAAKFPKLAKLSSIGKSWETVQGKANRQLWAMHITGEGEASTKPGMVILGAHHARELVTVEIPVRLIKHLLENYGKDADVTALVDTRDIWIVPLVNPDGRIHAEKGQSWRKNTHADGRDFGKDGSGVDLNRNYGYQWGANGGSSTSPSSETFRGAAPFSEPEVAAVRDFMRSHTNLKIMHSYHSFSNLVLWPWGYTEDDSPDAATYEAIGKKMAAPGGYTPEQASDLYVASGVTDDFAYGELKMLSFTTEVGTWNDGFDPPFSRVSKFWQENLPGDMLLLKLADKPLRVFGPEVTQATGTRSGGSTTVALTISNGSAITGAEFFLDRPGTDGAGTAISGQFGQAELKLSTSIARTSEQKRLVFVHAKDAEGDWGPFTAAYL